MTRRSLALAVGLCAGLLLLAACPATTAGDGEASSPHGAEAVFRLKGPLVPGYASIPWQVAFSPDGRWLTVIEGYGPNLISVYDARSHDLRWRRSVEEQPASYRPVFSRDGERLVHVEGDALVIRERAEHEWRTAQRIALGFDPGVTMMVRPVVLSPDEREAALCDGGRGWRVPLGTTPEPPKDVGLEDVVALAYRQEGGLYAARWGSEVAETVIVLDSGAVPAKLPFAILGASPDAKTWLVARNPRREDATGVALELVDARTRVKLGAFSIEAERRRGGIPLVQAEFTPDSRHLMTIESLLRGVLRDARTGRVLQRVLEYEGDRMISFAFRPDGLELVTGGRRSGDDVQEQAILSWERRGD